MTPATVVTSARTSAVIAGSLPVIVKPPSVPRTSRRSDRTTGSSSRPDALVAPGPRRPGGASAPAVAVEPARSGTPPASRAVTRLPVATSRTATRSPAASKTSSVPAGPPSTAAPASSDSVVRRPVAMSMASTGQGSPGQAARTTTLPPVTPRPGPVPRNRLDHPGRGIEHPDPACLHRTRRHDEPPVRRDHHVRGERPAKLGVRLEPVEHADRRPADRPSPDPEVRPGGPVHAVLDDRAPVRVQDRAPDHGRLIGHGRRAAPGRVQQAQPSRPSRRPRPPARDRPPAPTRTTPAPGPGVAAAARRCRVVSRCAASVPAAIQHRVHSIPGARAGRSARCPSRDTGEGPMPGSAPAPDTGRPAPRAPAAITAARGASLSHRRDSMSRYLLRRGCRVAGGGRGGHGDRDQLPAAYRGPGATLRGSTGPSGPCRTDAVWSRSRCDSGTVPLR